MSQKIISLILIVLSATLLRFWNYEGRTTYGWDQTRDIGVLEQSLSTHQLPLLGPIVRGTTGGFYLGPLYHYLLLPIYSLTGHNPLSLVWVSILLDILVVVFLVLSFGPIAGVIWVFSSMLINSSLTPWNVSLIHPWILAVILLSSRLTSLRNVFLFLLILSTTTSIHLTLIPLAFVLFVFCTPAMIHATRRSFHYLFYLLALILPQIPLLVSDLSNGGANARAFKDFLFVKSNAIPVSLLEFIKVLISKIGYTTSRLFVGEPYLVFGYLIFFALVLYALIHRRLRHELGVSLLIIFTLIGSLLVYRDPGFAEYYLNAMLVPLVILSMLATLRCPRPLLYLSLLLIIGLNLRSLDFRTGPYTLGAKRDLLTVTAPHLQEGVELRLLLPDYQQFGFAYYLTKLNISNDPLNHLKLYIAPADLEHVPAPQDAQSIIYQTTYSVFKAIVFSN